MLSYFFLQICSLLVFVTHVDSLLSAKGRSNNHFKSPRNVEILNRLYISNKNILSNIQSIDYRYLSHALVKPLRPIDETGYLSMYSTSNSKIDLVVSRSKLNTKSFSKLFNVMSGTTEYDKPDRVQTTDSKRNWPVIAISSANLIKNSVGAGVFSLNARVSAISSNPMTLIPASALILLMAAWAAYNFYMVGETCRLTNSSTYVDAWSNSVSKDSSWIVQFVTVVAPIISSLANVIVLTDILSFTLRYFNIPSSVWSNRNLVITLLSYIILFPISISKDLSGLRAVSVFGILGHLLAVMTLGIRLRDKSYFPGGIYYNQIVNSLPISSTYSPSKFFVLASLLSYCFVTHYNAPRYYNEIKEKDSNQSSFPLFASVSYFTAGLMYIVTMVFGLALFGHKSQSFALNSFAINDPLANIARLAFGSSVLASFPLIFLSVRTWFIQLIMKAFPSNKEDKLIPPASIFLITCIGLIASKVTDIGIVGSLSGGLLGSSMMFIFPPIMYSGALMKASKRDGTPKPLWKIYYNSILAVLGGALGFFGTGLTIASILKK